MNKEKPGMRIARILSCVSYLCLAVMAVLGIFINIPRTFLAVSVVVLLFTLGFSFGYVVDHLEVKKDE